MVFKLTRSNGAWTLTHSRDFDCGGGGCNPYSGVTFDANGNLYGTTFEGGVYGYGVVREIMP